MKRCPTCSRVYDDLNLRFCLDDGTALVNKLPDSEAPPTAVLSEPAIPTIAAAAPGVSPAYRTAAPTVAAARRKPSPMLWILGGGVLLLTVGVIVVAAVFLLWNKPVLGWHLVLEVAPPTTADNAAVVKQTVSVIENRLNAAGVSRFEVKPDGTRIFVNLPAVKDPERIKHLISTGGKLELVHVISDLNPSPVQTYDTQEQAIALLNNGGRSQSNRRVLPFSDRDNSPAGKKWVAVESPAIVDGADLRDASAVKNSFGSSYDINFSLNKAGAAKFANWTASNINHYLGVVLNDEVKSIAFIRSQIADQGVISGRFTKEAAEDLALVLKAGALPTPVKFVEERIDK
jgi:protein-export membrane protein SecD